MHELLQQSTIDSHRFGLGRLQARQCGICIQHPLGQCTCLLLGLRVNHELPWSALLPGVLIPCPCAQGLRPAASASASRQSSPAPAAIPATSLPEKDTDGSCHRHKVRSHGEARRARCSKAGSRVCPHGTEEAREAAYQEGRRVTRILTSARCGAR